MIEPATFAAIQRGYHAAMERARARARAMLKPGDRLYVERCGGIRSTITFVGFVNHYGLPDEAGNWIAGKTIDDVSAWHVLRVNKQPVTFRDDEGEAAVERHWLNQREIMAVRLISRAVERLARMTDPDDVPW